MKTKFKPTPISYKDYECSNCWHVKKIDTNHYGECYSFWRSNACPKCPPYKQYPEFWWSPIVWKCLEKAPSPENVPSKWKQTTIKID